MTEKSVPGFKLGYTAMVQWSDDDEVYIATYKELEGCISHGDTPEEAFKNLSTVGELYLQGLSKDGGSIPSPYDHFELPSGKWLQRVPRSLHKDAAKKAADEGVSLNQWVMHLIARAVGGQA